jgi:hypothetical protein
MGVEQLSGNLYQIIDNSGENPHKMLIGIDDGSVATAFIRIEPPVHIEQVVFEELQSDVGVVITPEIETRFASSYQATMPNVQDDDEVDFNMTVRERIIYTAENLFNRIGDMALENRFIKKYEG